jgi:cell division septal protein FtsQ
MTKVRYVGNAGEDRLERAYHASRNRRSRSSIPGTASRRARRAPRRLGLRWAVAGLALLIGGMGALSAFLRVDRIEVRGAVAADSELLRAVLPQAFGQRLLLLDGAPLRQALAADPWIRKVDFSPLLDGTLVVRIEEAVPVFSLEDGGAISGDGQWLPPRRDIDVSGLTLLRIPPREGEAVLSKGVREIVRNLCTTLNRTPWTWPSGLESVEVETNGSVRLFTGGGVEVVLGSEGWERRLSAMAAALPSLRPGPGDRLDLRFDRQVIVTPAGVPGGRLGG